MAMTDRDFLIDAKLIAECACVTRESFHEMVAAILAKYYEMGRLDQSTRMICAQIEGINKQMKGAAA
jgi:hypothetical protein